MSADPPILVTKVGGSLLTWPGLPEALRRWLDSQGSRRVVLVPGGGRAADFVRELDRVHRLIPCREPFAGGRLTPSPLAGEGWGEGDEGGDRKPLAVGLRQGDRLGEEAAHALALRALDLSAHALAAIVPGLVVVEDFAAMVEAWAAGQVPVLAPRRTLDAGDGRPGALEHSWRVTSDSIAARLAVLLGADLLLLKSAPLPPGLDRVGAAHAGLVDEAFPEASEPIARVAYLNLREPSAISPRPI